LVSFVDTEREALVGALLSACLMLCTRCLFPPFIFSIPLAREPPSGLSPVTGRQGPGRMGCIVLGNALLRTGRFMTIRSQSYLVALDGGGVGWGGGGGRQNLKAFTGNPERLLWAGSVTAKKTSYNISSKSSVEHERSCQSRLWTAVSLHCT
jgi:hypothetical protein